MRTEQINQYYEFLTALPNINNRCYSVSGNYSEIEVESGTKYYVFNIERETYLAPLQSGCLISANLELQKTLWYQK